MIVLGVSCNVSRDTDGVLLYYPTHERSGLRSQTLDTERFIPEGSEIDWPLQTLTRLAQSPSDSRLNALFPSTVKVVSLQIDTGWADVQLSENYREVTGIDKTLCEAAITLTLCQFDEIDSVTIRVTGRGGEASPLRTASDFIMSDLSLKLVEWKFTLYKPDSTGQYLTPEPRNLILRENDPPERYVMEELMAIPGNHELRLALGPDNQLLSVVRDGDLCYVNLSRSFWDNVPPESLRQRLTLCSIVNSLTELPEINRVQLLMDGSPQMLYGEFAVDEPLSADTLSLTSEASVYSAVLLYPSTRDGTPVEIPALLPAYSGLSEPQLLLDTLFSQSPLGLVSPILPDLMLREVERNDNTVTVDLNCSSPPERVTQALWYIRSTLTRNLPELTVQILLNGEALEQQ